MADPLDAAGLAKNVAHVYVTSRETGVTTELVTRLDSRCHFFEPFPAGAYNVQLRLDWADRDDRGHPTLDADFIDMRSGRHDHAMCAHPAHHTGSLPGGAMEYQWEFEDSVRTLSVAVAWKVSGVAQSTSQAVGHVTAVPPQNEVAGG
ncbi:MAG: hypothetical protein U1E26_09795 [Coriobacteriia bacterium]|nr:hypothetical protein [Coriobacteriia bacterium]